MAGSKRKKEELVRTLQHVAQIMGDLGIEYFIMFGTLLGYVRSHEVIDGDDDVDIYVNTKYYQKILNIAQNIGANDKLYLGIVKENSIIQIYFSDAALVDIYFYDETETEIIENWNFGFGQLRLPKEEIFPLTKTEMHGQSIWIPMNPLFIVKYFYGPRYKESLRKKKDYQWIFADGKLRVEYRKQQFVMVGNWDFFAYIEDYLKTMIPTLEYIYEFYNSNINPWTLNFENERHHIIFYPLPEMHEIARDNVNIINVEQLTRPGIADQMRERIAKGTKYIEFSSENMAILPEIQYYIPYQYVPEEVDKLREYSNVQPEYDVAIVGTESLYRYAIINELQARGIRFCYIKGWKDERDAQIGRSRLLLNLHYSSEYRIFEHIRCDRWIFAGKMIISEETYNKDLLDIRDLVIFEDYSKLVDKVQEVLANYDKYMAELREKHDKLMPSIRDNREKIIRDFKKNA